VVELLEEAKQDANISKGTFFDARRYLKEKGDVVETTGKPKWLSLTAWDEEEAIPE
jgi:hypothetical protein